MADSGSESSEEDFRPEQAVGSDEEGDSAPTEQPREAPVSPEDVEEASRADDAMHADQIPAREQEIADEEPVEPESDDEDDEEGAVSRRPRKRARRDPRNQFIDVEAEVDDEDEAEEEDEDLDADPFIAGMHPDDAADLPEDTANDDRQHRQLDAQREKRQQLDAEEEVQRLKEKYGRRTAAASDAAIVPRRLLLPSVDDPSIWGVKCKPGKEREIIFSVVKRMDERMGTKDQVPVISVFERGGTMAGFVYVEARRQADVLTALDGIMNVYPRAKTVLVPIKEMPDLLRVLKLEQLAPGNYVRLKRGKYAGDLAQIDDIETNGLEASLKIVPRLDYGQNEGAKAPGVDGNIRGDLAKRKRIDAVGLTSPAVRPPPRLFSEVEAKKRHARHLQPLSQMGKKSFSYMNDTYVNGFLIKDVKIQHLVTENVNPTLEEVTRFTSAGEDGVDNLDLTALAASLKRGPANENYLPGDSVEVFEGEQKGVVGKALSVRADIVTVRVAEGDLQGQSIEVPAKGLRKRFKEGDHVKVIGGSKYHDEVGMVVSIQGETVTFLSDLTLREVSVFSKDLREASDSGVAGGLGLYDIHDLVQLDPATVGCVIKVDRESLRVLDQYGSVRSIMPSQVSNKLERRRNAVATDRNGSEIRMDDTVREIGGEQKTGLILHIYRSFLFIHNREQTENSGIAVVRSTNVATVAAKGGRVAQNSAGPDLTKMNPATMLPSGMDGMPPPAPKAFGRDRAIGQTVTIRKGAYKGLLGIIKDTTDREARVELHTKGKTVTVSKDVVGFKDSLTGNAINYAQFLAGRGRGMSTGAIPSGGRMPAPASSWNQNDARTPNVMGGAHTPAWGAGAGGRTPAWGGAARTPAWDGAVGARTPAWDGAGTARTPAWDGAGASRTPAWGGAAGSRTPAWDGATARTPAWEGAARTSAWEGASRTPAWEGAARTPAWEGASRTPAWEGATGSRTPAWEGATGAKTPAWDGNADARTPAWGGPAGGQTPAWGGPTGARTPAWTGAN